MILEGKIKSGLGNANFWIKKVEKVFYKKTGKKLYHGTLNIELENSYELKNYWVIQQEEYGGTQEVKVQECIVLGQEAFIIRSEKTAHKSNIIEIVSDVNFREKFNLHDGDIIEVVL